MWMFLGSIGLLIALVRQGNVSVNGSFAINSTTMMWLSGLLCLVLMTWQSLLWIRPVSSSWLKDFFWVNGLHKRLGIGTLLLLLMHPIAVVVAYAVDRTYAIVPDFSSSFETWVTVWKIGFILTILILFTSILSRKRISFRKWHWIHLLSYPLMIAMWLHGWFTGTSIDMYASIHTYWIILGIVIAGLIIVRLAYQYGYLKHKGIVLAHTQITSDIYEINLQLSDHIHYEHGQFIYLQMKRGGESHPFTVLSYDSNTQIMRLSYKALGRFTNALAQHKDTIKQMYVDGPYGTFTSDITASEPIICIAGWIGITPFYHLLTQNTLPQSKLIYLNKTQHDTAYLTDLSSALDQRLINIFSRDTEGTHTNNSLSIFWKRLDPSVIKQTLQDNLSSYQFYICGSKSVITGVKEMLLTLWVSSSHIHREPFEM